MSQEYFCDRKTESRNLIQEITNGNNLVLISTWRMGKTGLIQLCFQSEGIRKNYYTFFVDIYATKSLRDFVFSLSKVILEGLKPFGKKALQHFWESVKSLQASVAFDINGITWYMQKILHTLYNMTSSGSICDVDMVDEAVFIYLFDGELWLFYRQT